MASTILQSDFGVWLDVPTERYSLRDRSKRGRVQSGEGG